jgi:hypothetical protein
MGILETLLQERKRLLAELAKIEKAIALFDERGTGRPSRSAEMNAVSRTAQVLRWARERKEGKEAIAKASRALEAAKKRLAETKR